MGKIAGFVAVAMITLVSKAGGGSGDVEQVIAKPPTIVRATLSAALIDEPTQTLTGPDGSTTSVRTRIDRHDDEIVQTIVIDDRPGFISTFSFEPEDGGSSTRVKVDYEIDRAHIDSTSYARGNRKTAISDSDFERSLKNTLSRLDTNATAGFVSAGSYQSDPASDFGMTSLVASASSSEYARSNEMRPNTNSYARRHARPMASTAPIVDPSAVARAHVRGDSYDD